ncbi:MAG: aldo/keto reductase, partial [Planctomycetes bacterium]|nr:aldo/keto reductase [Planctomycetota bacterium]
PRFRNEVTLSTKLSARDAEGAKRQLDESLRLLGTDRLDILHFHSVSTREDTDRITAKGGALEAYRRWKDEGVTRAIGITGHQDAEVLLDAVRRIEPDCVMCPQNPAHAGPMVNGAAFTKLVNPHALGRGIGLLGMKATGQNRLVGKGGVSAEALVRYALALPVAAVVIGMPDLAVVESCARIARTLEPMTEEERERMRSRVAVAAIDGTLPYLAAGYRDEGCQPV